MEKRTIILTFLLVLLIAPFTSSNTITGEAITGEATSQETGVSVFVEPAQPLLVLISPEAKTYNYQEYILLDYNAILMDTIWYNLDNGLNVTINDSFYFQTTPGSHTLYLFGNQSNGTILTDSVTFTVKSKSSPGPAIIVGPEEDDEIPISLDKERIDIELKQGESERVKVLVKNNEDQTVQVNIEDLNLDSFLTSISETSFSLNAKETKEIFVTFQASNDTIPNIYLEKILITTATSEKEVSFYIEVESKEFLFDVEVSIPEEPILFYAGDTLTAYVMFYNLGKEGQTNVEVQYEIINPLDKEVVFGETQTLVIGTSANITRQFTIPEDVSPGDYIFYVKAIYDDKTASASKWFKVIGVTFLPKPIHEIAGAIKRDGEEIAKAIFTLTTIFLITTIAQLIGAKQGWWGAIGKRRTDIYGAASRKRKYYGVGKRRHAHLIGGKTRLGAAAARKKKSTSSKSPWTYKQKVRHSVKKIRKKKKS